MNLSQPEDRHPQASRPRSPQTPRTPTQTQRPAACAMKSSPTFARLWFPSKHLRDRAARAQGDRGRDDQDCSRQTRQKTQRALELRPADVTSRKIMRCAADCPQARLRQAPSKTEPRSVPSARAPKRSGRLLDRLTDVTIIRPRLDQHDAQNAWPSRDNDRRSEIRNKTERSGGGPRQEEAEKLCRDCKRAKQIARRTASAATRPAHCKYSMTPQISS